MEASDIFGALASPIRRDILFYLKSKPRTVNEIAATQKEVGRSTVSEHLQVLRHVGLVKEERVGREWLYHLNPKPLIEVESWINEFKTVWKSRLIDLERLINRMEKKNEK